MKVLKDVDYNRFFHRPVSVLSGHSMKLFKPRCRTNYFKIYFLAGWSIFEMVLIKIVLQLIILKAN